MSKNIEKKAEEPQSPPECFVIMPIADPDGYDKGHFTKVYEDIFKPACEVSGYRPVRADEVKQTNLIHLDILQKLIESPMAICDLRDGLKKPFLEKCSPATTRVTGLRFRETGAFSEFP
jgi:hypothetical protein